MNRKKENTTYLMVVVLTGIRMGYFKLSGTYNNNLVPLPHHFRADQKIKPIMQGIVQMPPFKALADRELVSVSDHTQ